MFPCAVRVSRTRTVSIVIMPTYDIVTAYGSMDSNFKATRLYGVCCTSDDNRRRALYDIDYTGLSWTKLFLHSD